MRFKNAYFTQFPVYRWLDMLEIICMDFADLKEREASENSKLKYMSQPGIEPVTLCFLAGQPSLFGYQDSWLPVF